MGDHVFSKAPASAQQQITSITPKFDGSGGANTNDFRHAVTRLFASSPSQGELCMAMLTGDADASCASLVR